MDDLFTPLTPATRNGGSTRKCRRHEWEPFMPEGGVIIPISIEPLPNRCSRCHTLKDEARQRRNINNRKRGNRTSHDLAVFLGGRNVEALKEPWDIEACGARIQSKRLADRPSAVALCNLLDAIQDHGEQPLRAVFYVAPRQRIAAGTVYVDLAEWVGWHGWTLPTDATLLNAKGRPLAAIPVATFREWRA